MYIAPRSRLDKTAQRGQEDAFLSFHRPGPERAGVPPPDQVVPRSPFWKGTTTTARRQRTPRQYGDGSSPSSGCLKGELAQALLADKDAQALKIVETYQGFFGKENYYLELMDHGLPRAKTG